MEDRRTDYRKEHVGTADDSVAAATIVALQIAVHERDLRQQVKAARGKWTPREVVWELPYGQVVALGLTNRIVPKANTST